MLNPIFQGEIDKRSFFLKKVAEEITTDSSLMEKLNLSHDERENILSLADADGAENMIFHYLVVAWFSRLILKLSNRMPRDYDDYHSFYYQNEKSVLYGLKQIFQSYFDDLASNIKTYNFRRIYFHLKKYWCDPSKDNADASFIYRIMMEVKRIFKDEMHLLYDQVVRYFYSEDFQDYINMIMNENDGNDDEVLEKIPPEYDRLLFAMENYEVFEDKIQNDGLLFDVVDFICSKTFDNFRDEALSNEARENENVKIFCGKLIRFILFEIASAEKKHFILNESRFSAFDYDDEELERNSAEIQDMINQRLYFSKKTKNELLLMLERRKMVAEFSMIFKHLVFNFYSDYLTRTFENEIIKPALQVFPSLFKEQILMERISRKNRFLLPMRMKKSKDF